MSGLREELARAMAEHVCDPVWERECLDDGAEPVGALRSGGRITHWGPGGGERWYLAEQEAKRLRVEHPTTNPYAPTTEETP